MKNEDSVGDDLPGNIGYAKASDGNRYMAISGSNQKIKEVWLL